MSTVPGWRKKQQVCSLPLSHAKPSYFKTYLLQNHSLARMQLASMNAIQVEGQKDWQKGSKQRIWSKGHQHSSVLPIPHQAQQRVTNTNAFSGQAIKLTRNATVILSTWKKKNPTSILLKINDLFAFNEMLALSIGGCWDQMRKDKRKSAKIVPD